MENKKVILLTAYAQSGKDTVADYLEKNYGYLKISFAHPLYSMLSAMYGHINMSKSKLEEMKCYDARLPGADVNVRQMLQTLGTEWGRCHVATNIWPQILRQKINLTSCNKFVVSDCRFINELETIRSDQTLDYRLLFIERDKCTPQLHHKSEQEIEDLRHYINCHTIKNNMSLNVLYDHVDRIMENIWRE